jgi:hypothetical protein
MAERKLTLKDRIKIAIGPSVPLWMLPLPKRKPLVKRGTGCVVALEDLSRSTRIKINTLYNRGAKE